MTNIPEMYDITIIGGGPVGLFAAFYGGMRHAKVKIIESLPQLGGQLSTLYPEKKIYDIAGFPEITAQELVNNLEAQMARFHTTVCLEEEVLDIDKNEDGTFELRTDQATHFSKAIIVTAGNGAFQPRRLDLPKATLYEKENLHYFVNDLERFRDHKVAVCGGGDSAVDWALMLEPVAKEVTLIHRRNDFRAHEHSVHLLKNSKVAVKTPFVPTELIGDAQKMTKIELKQVRGDEKVELEVDDFVVTHGFISTLGPIKNWGLALEKNAIVVNSKMETSIPGIYAAGDICTYVGKINLIVSGFGEAPTAINHAMHYIQPETRVQPMHSTSMFG